MITLVKLVDGATEFVFQNNAVTNYDIVWTKLSAPSPAVRTSVRDRTGTDGTNDRTKYHGARSVSLDVSLYEAPAAKLDVLNGMLHPMKRPYLYVTDTDWNVPNRRIRLRCDQFGNEIVNTGSWWRDVPLQWVAPSGQWESEELNTFDVIAQVGEATGRTYDFTPPRSYPASTYLGRVTILNPGNTFSNHTTRLYGPCAGPRFTNDLTGEAVVFKDTFEIPFGEFVEINTRDKTAFYMGDTSASRLGEVNFPTTTWWRLSPGFNDVRYNPISGVDVGCVASVMYRPMWI